MVSEVYCVSFAESLAAKLEAKVDNRQTLYNTNANTQRFFTINLCQIKVFVNFFWNFQL